MTFDTTNVQSVASDTYTRDKVAVFVDAASVEVPINRVTFFTQANEEYCLAMYSDRGQLYQIARHTNISKETITAHFIAALHLDDAVALESTLMTIRYKAQRKEEVAELIATRVTLVNIGLDPDTAKDERFKIPADVVVKDDGTIEVVEPPKLIEEPVEETAK